MDYTIKIGQVLYDKHNVKHTLIEINPALEGWGFIISDDKNVIRCYHPDLCRYLYQVIPTDRIGGLNQLYLKQQK
jgi:hypothetical protein